MFRQLYDWIQNFAVYLIVVSAVMHAVPGKEYEKYIRFFSGLIMILLLFMPLMNLTGMADEFLSLYNSREYEMNRHGIESAEEIIRGIDILDFVPEEYRGAAGSKDAGTGAGGTDEAGAETAGERIEVGEIRIGEEQD